MGIDGKLTTAEAAEKLGKTIRHVQWLITEGRLPAQKIGRDYLINEGDLKLVSNLKRGRPAKAKAETDVKASKKKAKG
jgi:excisionase family DNA binding protein